MQHRKRKKNSNVSALTGVCTMDILCSRSDLMISNMLNLSVIICRVQTQTVCENTLSCVCMHACVRVCMCVRMCACLHACVCVCMCVCVCIHACARVCSCTYLFRSLFCLSVCFLHSHFWLYQTLALTLQQIFTIFGFT